MIIVSERAKKLATAAKMYEIIVQQGYTYISDWWIRNLVFNMQFCISDLPKDVNFLYNFIAYLEKLRIGNGIKLEPAQLTVVSSVIDHYKPRIAEYNSPLALSLTEAANRKKNEKVNILFTMTTCKRFDLMEKTMNSIMNTWTDLDLVDKFFCVDDNSRQIDRSKMAKAYPFFEFHMKTKAEKGHRTSMNIIYNKIKEVQPTYWIHLEDDWFFFQKSSYIKKSIDFLERQRNKDQPIHQVLFNRNYAETYDGWTINGSEPLEKDFIVHLKSDAIPGQNCGYWPHYSFRPSVIRADKILELGNYDSPNTFFERDYADRYFAKGYKSAFFDTITCLHIGKLTSDKSGTNAYTLNNMGQFSANASGKPSNFVVNLLRRTDRKEAVETAFEAANITNYEFYEAVDGSKLEPTEEITKLFANNDFGSRKGFIGCALSHYYLWKQLKADPQTPFYTIFEDDITLCEGFKEKMEAAQTDLEGVDLLFLGYHVRSNNKHHIMEKADTKVLLNNNIYIGGFYAYVITQSGCKKLLEYIEINGIKHGIDYLVKIVPGLKSYNLQPHIVFSDWVESADSSVNTDIQKDHSSLNLVKKVNKEDWIFYEGVDSSDGDFKGVGKKPIDELLAIADEHILCSAVNTLGFLKYNVKKHLKRTPYIHSPGTGVYVRKGYMYKEAMNIRPIIKEKYEVSDLIGLSARCDWFIYHNGHIMVKDTYCPSTIFISAYKGDLSLMRFITDHLPRIYAPFNLIIAGDDYTFPTGKGDIRKNYYANIQDQVNKLIEHKFVNKIFVENLDTIHPKLVPIPIGIIKNGLQGYNSLLELTDFPIDFSTRPIQCFCLHRMRGGEQWNLRMKVKSLCEEEWSTFVKYNEEGTLQYDELMKSMRMAKFCLCVRGGGYDPSPKCWEALMNGCIPIIEHSPLDEVYSRFPVVFVDRWEADTITKEKLDGWLADLRPFYEDPVKRKEVLNMLTMDYWWNIVRLPPRLNDSQEKRWVSATICGGLGNRLFQISCAMGLAEKLNRPVVFYLPKVWPSFHQDVNNIYKMFPDIKFVTEVEENLHVITEASHNTYVFVKDSIPNTDKCILIRGYKQSHKYFPTAGIHPKLEELVDADKWKELQARYEVTTESERLRTWSIHLRLGDYIDHACLNHVNVESFHKKAIELANIPEEAKIIIFSNDPTTARGLIQPYMKNPFIICDEKDEIVSLALMSICWGGAIVPNSTFSWWGAYLAHRKTPSPSTFRAFYPTVWNIGNGVFCKDLIPSWGTSIMLSEDDDGWVFHPKLDSTGGDIDHKSGCNSHQLKQFASEDPNCVAFNTLGFMKSSVRLPLTTSLYFVNGGGLYVKKSYKPKTRIKMLCNWCSSQDLCKEWLKMTKGDYIWNDLQITWEDQNIDYYIIINKPPPGAHFVPEKTIIFHMEPWCGDESQKWGVKTWGEWAKPDPKKFLQVRSHDNYYNTVFWQLNMTYNQLKEGLAKEKRPAYANVVSSICSSKYFDPGHKKRIDFMKFIESKQDPAVQLHLYNEDNEHGFKGYQGKARPSIDKERGILPYKYYFMCENNAEKNFITEKLWEPILCESLCFYWGCPNVADYINPLAYVQLNMDDFEGSFAIMKDAIESNLWERRLPYIQKEKQKVLEFYGFFPTVERILKPKVVCFVHSCHLESAGTANLDMILAEIRKVQEIESIIINNIGIPLDTPSYTGLDNRISIIQYSDNTQLFEIPTLKLIHEFAKDNQNTKILYVHTKGISYDRGRPSYINMINWINMMLYFLADSKNIELLDTYDTLGCNFLEAPSPHYSGNFWWATGKYLSTLSPEKLTDKMSAEWWLHSANPNKLVLHNSRINHFMNPYPLEVYKI
jgi:GR25 family glycosyltransferase involved in LPS biosynthesis